MRKLFYLLMMLAIVGCQNENFGYTREYISNEKFVKEYNDNFIRDYGTIAEGHTWGFDDIPETRATTSGSGQYRIVHQNNNGINIEHEYGANDGSDKQYARYNYPGAVSQEEKEYVWDYLQKHPNEGSTECDLSSYFLLNLGLHEHNYIADDGRTIDNKHMDQIWFDNTHFQSYNNGVGFDYYVTNTAITNPKYHESYGQDWKTDNYRFYYIPGYGLYLCFDYETTNSQNGKVKGDGKYDDWVIKVVPGKGEPYGHEYRVFCEDLGSTLDLDFNDLVFDYIELGNNETAIKLLALEGTLPIYIDNIDLKNGDMTAYHTLQPRDIIYINKKITDPNLIRVETNFHGTCFIANTLGRAPYLLRCPVGTEWPGENVRIESVYPEFIFYVSDPSIPWWNN